MTDDESLLESLKQAATPSAPPNFRPGITFQGRTPSEIVTPPLPMMESQSEFESAVRELGYPIPEDMALILVEMQMVQHEAFWQRDPADKGTKDSAYTAPSSSWRYRFKVVPKSLRDDMDLRAMIEEAAMAVSVRVRPTRSGHVTKVISLADFQTGKVDILGGTAELLARSELALAMVIEDLETTPHDEIIIIDPGDSTEGFESAPNAAQTSDLDLTEQIRVWRRILWRWVSTLSDLAPVVKVVGVPSNHCRVRRGKNVQGKPLDDWGIEVIAQCYDIAAGNPALYEHIEFIIPEEYQEHVLVQTVGGKVLGVAHGHQKSSVDALPGWVKSTGRNGLSQADIVVVGHFHHLQVRAFGDGQWLFVSPSNENGSSWFTPSSGESSRPGVLTFRVDEDGWFDLDPIWL